MDLLESPISRRLSQEPHCDCGAQGQGHTPTQMRSLGQRVSEGDSALHCFLGIPHSWGGEGGRRKEMLSFGVMEAAQPYSLK